MKFGLIGYPLTHSFSKKYFTRKFQKNQWPHSYENFELKDFDISTFLLNNSLDGFNVTIPFKEKVLPYLDEISQDAQEIGAVNCVKIEKSNNKNIFKGYNTDWKAFYQSLQPLLKKHHKQALILGTGGAAKAVAYALKKTGIPYHFVSRKKHLEAILYSDVNQSIIQSHQIIVNTTPLGMCPHIDTYPDIPYQYITANHLLYDLIYNPEKTLFMTRGKKQGATVKNGKEMLILQAEESFKIWTNENIY